MATTDNWSILLDDALGMTAYFSAAERISMVGIIEYRSYQSNADPRSIKLTISVP